MIIVQENGIHDDPFFDLLVGVESSGSLTPAIVLNWLEYRDTNQSSIAPSFDSHSRGWSWESSRTNRDHSDHISSSNKFKFFIYLNSAL